MIENFKNHIHQNWPFLVKKNLLLAVSGGLDSMVMWDLMAKLNPNIAIIHCNFKLRNAESDADQEFVEQRAKDTQTRCFVKAFDTESYAQKNHLSIQVAARKLRYDWFAEICNKHQFDYVLTAHHADDDLETFLINLSRGTGLDGLTGILNQNNHIIRPLLPFSRIELETFAQQNMLKWREDSSNNGDYYLRNKIRHTVVPPLKKIDSHFLEAFQKTQKNLQETESLVKDAVDLMFKNVVLETENKLYFDVLKLKKISNFKAYIYQWLKKYGFTDWKSVYDLLDAQTGKQVLAPEFVLLKNRNHLILSPSKTGINEIILIEEGQKNVNFPIKLQFSEVSTTKVISNETIFVETEKIQFPLTLRTWQNGDVFFPTGMNGKTKKVSKFFKDLKLSITEKQQIWLLCSDNQIVWIIGLRQDERFKPQQSTNILQISLIP